MKKPDRVIVHGGIFHIDDVTVVALLKKAFGEIEVRRMNDISEFEADENTIIADIGNGKYDHHQMDAKLRPDGNKYAACGLIYDEIAELIFPDAEAIEYFRNVYIIPIEDHDNGLRRDTLSVLIGAMNPQWDSNVSFDDAFNNAVQLMCNIIENEIKAAKSRINAKTVFDSSNRIMNGKVLILPKYIPWKAYVSNTDLEYVIAPGMRNDICIECVPKDVINDPFSQKKPLPQQWLENKPEGCTFVHTSRFLAAFDTKENAVKACEKLYL